MKVPVEIMHEIVEHVARPLLDGDTNNPGSPPRTLLTQSDAAQALQTLFNLCLVSHMLYDITLPVLYREFALGYNDTSGIFLQPQMGQRMVAFSRTLLLRRDLAGLVKRAFLHPKLVEQMGWENKKMISALAKKKLNNAVFDDQPIETLIYALMPNLERLVFAGQSWVMVPIAVREVAWKHLKGPEQTDEYGWRFTEAEVVRIYDQEMSDCTYIPLPDEDDDL